MRSERPLGSYGVDAPWVPWMWIGYAILYTCLAIASVVLWSAWRPITVLLCVVALASVLGAALFWYASLRGKFILWEQILRSANVCDRRNALDLGCGHGMVAIMTARRAPAMTVVGIDLWRSVDQSGNTPEAAQANARMNGVDDRVRFDTGDMTALPYESNSFDLITASLAIHNIPSREGRRDAINEAVRVLSDGGTILIADIRRTKQYAQDLRAAGLHVKTQPLGWRGWWSGPWMATTSLSAVKPPAPKRTRLSA